MQTGQVREFLEVPPSKPEVRRHTVQGINTPTHDAAQVVHSAVPAAAASAAESGPSVAQIAGRG